MSGNNIITNKSSFYKNKKLSKIDEIDVDKIQDSKKESYGTKSSLKYFIRYNNDVVIKTIMYKPSSSYWIKC